MDFLGTRPFVDRDRIGALGICGSGSFVISAAKIDPRMRAIATVSMYDMGAANRNGLKHSTTVEQRKKALEESAAQRYVEFTGGGARYTIGTVHELNEKSTAIEREFYDFYRTPRGEVTPKGSSPELTTHPTLTSNAKFMNFYPLNDIETISPRPMLFITGDVAHSREFSEDAYERAAEPKELYVVPTAGHVDLYDRVNGSLPQAKTGYEKGQSGGILSWPGRSRGRYWFGFIYPIVNVVRTLNALCVAQRSVAFAAR
ncbi:MAG TPA: alpha/beta hydrolase [Bryobacteraceae bacterium]|nr:alpha/beta hydrolase [Bryobacteraceae bacterium]